MWRGTSCYAPLKPWVALKHQYDTWTWMAGIAWHESYVRSAVKTCTVMMAYMILCLHYILVHVHVLCQVHLVLFFLPCLVESLPDALWEDRHLESKSPLWLDWCAELSTELTWSWRGGGGGAPDMLPWSPGLPWNTNMALEYEWHCWGDSVLHLIYNVYIICMYLCTVPAESTNSCRPERPMVPA